MKERFIAMVFHCSQYLRVTDAQETIKPGMIRQVLFDSKMIAERIDCSECEDEFQRRQKLASLHRAKAIQEALHAVCVTVFAPIPH
jgi:hypothetical protein